MFDISTLEFEDEDYNEEAALDGHEDAPEEGQEDDDFASGFGDEYPADPPKTVSRQPKNVVELTSLAKLQKVRDSIVNTKGYYTVKADGIMLIARTNKIAAFDNFRKGGMEGVSVVVVETYSNDNESNRKPSARYTIDLAAKRERKREKAQRSVQDLVREEVGKAQLQWEMKTLQRDYLQLRGDMEKLKKKAAHALSKQKEQYMQELKEMEDLAEKQDDYIRQLKDKLEEAETQRQRFMGMSEVAGGLVSLGRELKRAAPDHPFSRAVESMPGGLGALFNEYPDKIEAPQNGEEKAIPVSEPDQQPAAGRRQANPSNGFDEQAIKFWRRVREKITEDDDFNAVVTLVKRMADEDGLRKTILDLAKN